MTFYTQQSKNITKTWLLRIITFMKGNQKGASITGFLIPLASILVFIAMVVFGDEKAQRQGFVFLGIYALMFGGIIIYVVFFDKNK